MKMFHPMLAVSAAAAALLSLIATQESSAQQKPVYDVSTLAGKVASVRGAAGLQIRFSALIEQEAEESAAFNPGSAQPITPAFVLSSPLDGTSVQAPNVTVNQDTAAASQNETAIVVDPNNPNRIVAAANDYVTRTWNCAVNG